MKNHTSQNSQCLQLSVIGSPINHSKSPLIQQAVIDEYQINATYGKSQIFDLDHLKDFLNQLKQPNWRGINVTIPYKEAVIPFLDIKDDAVAIIGACNTIVNKNGQLHGFNTDAEGFYIPLKTKSIQSALILGNGGAAKAVLYQCAKEGVNSLTLVARNHKKSDELVNTLNAKFDVNIKKIEFGSLTSDLVQSHQLIINTTSIGMNKNDEPFDAIKSIGENQLFYDLIYNPWETKMMSIAKANGAEILNGAWMLAGQGALAFEHFFGYSVNSRLMYDLLEKDAQ